MGRWRVRAAGAVLALVALAAGCGGERRPARIVLISIDTLRADHVGVLGAGPGRTPALDALAERGARFTRAVSPVPLTLPSHATLLTGREPYQHGVHHNGVYRLANDVPTLTERLRDAGFATAAFVAATVLDQKFGLGRGFERYDDRMTVNEPGRGGVGHAERPATAVVEAVQEWLGTAPERFFLFVHFYDAHAEYVPPPPWDGRFGGDRYAGEIGFVDDQLAVLLAAIDARYPDGRTLVVVVSDHGESLKEHGEPTHSYGIYEATQHIPLLMAGPGIPGGRSVDALVRLADVAPTLLELTGAPPLEGVAGRSLLSLLAGEAETPRVAYLETLATRLDMGWSPLFGLRTERWKLVRAPRPELYDLDADPRETRNLAAEDAGRWTELDRMLTALLADAPPAAPTLAVDADERARLEQLGYVVPLAGSAPIPLGEVGGIDPKDEIASVATLHDANALLGGDRPREALALLATIPRGGLEVARLRATAALAAGELTLAKQAARAAIAAAPEMDTGYTMLGLACERSGELAEAEAAYRKALEISPGVGWSMVALGRVAERRGDRKAAAALYAQARDVRVPSPDAKWRLAALRLEDGDRDAAFALLAELPPGVVRDPDAVLRLAEAERAAGRLDLALMRTEGALREHAGSTPLLRFQATLLEARGDLAAATRAREAALAIDAHDPASMNDLAWSLAKEGRDLDRALALARGAVDAAGPVPPLLDTLATVQVARGEASAARATIEQALPGADPTLREHLLELRARLGPPSAR
jgi:arylsulfatase A-like enzyme/Flp pilus assembly protein TadD